MDDLGNFEDYVDPDEEAIEFDWSTVKEMIFKGDEIHLILLDGSELCTGPVSATNFSRMKTTAFMNLCEDRITVIDDES